MCANRADIALAHEIFCVILAKLGDQEKEFICKDVDECKKLIKELTDKGVDSLGIPSKRIKKS